MVRTLAPAQEFSSVNMSNEVCYKSCSLHKSIYSVPCNVNCTYSIWEALLSCNVEHGYVCLLKKFTMIRRHQCRQTKRVKFSISKKAPNRAIRCPSLLFNTVAAGCIKKRDPEMAKKKGEWVFT